MLLCSLSSAVMTQMSNIFRELKVLTLEKLRDASGGAQFFPRGPIYITAAAAAVHPLRGFKASS